MLKPWATEDELPDVRPVLAGIAASLRHRVADWRSLTARAARAVADDAQRPTAHLYVVEADPDGRDREIVAHDPERTFEYVACTNSCGRAVLVAGDPVVFAWTCFACRYRETARERVTVIRGGAESG